MEHIEKLSPNKRLQLEEFVNAHTNDKGVSVLDYQSWVTRCMELLGPENIPGIQKKELVIALYRTMSEKETNDFDAEFNIADVIQLIFETAENKFGIVRKLGIKTKLFSCMGIHTKSHNNMRRLSFPHSNLVLTPRSHQENNDNNLEINFNVNTNENTE